MIGFIGREGPLCRALGAHGDVRVVADVALWPRGPAPRGLVAGPGADGWRDVLAWARRTDVPLVGLSRLGTVAGHRFADVRVEEDAPLGDGAGVAELTALVAAEGRWARTPGGRRVLVRLPWLLEPGRTPHGHAGRVLDVARGPTHPPDGGTHLGDARDAAALVATLIDRLAAGDPVPSTVHCVGTAVALRALRDQLAQTGHAVEPRRWWARAPRDRALGLHWGAASLHAAALGHRPRPLRQTLVEVACTP